MNKLWELVLNIVAGLIVVIIHEYSKAFMATKLGDKTPKLNNRLTLNPLKHIDPLGFLLLILSGIGWANPVPINSASFKDRKKGTITVALTGIIASFMTALFILIFIRLNDASNFINMNMSALKLLDAIVFYSISLIVFNLMPIPPLAMSKLLSVFFPRTYFKMLQYEKIIQLVFLMLVILGFIQVLLIPVIRFIYFLLKLIIFF